MLSLKLCSIGVLQNEKKNLGHFFWLKNKLFMLSLLSFQLFFFSCKDEVFAYLSPFTFFDTLWTGGGYQYD